MMSIRRRYLTLIEIMIVMTILALVSGVVGINIFRAVKEQRFRTETDLITDSLRLAQNLMLIMDADVHLKLKAAPDHQGIQYWMEVEGGVPKKWEPLIPLKPKTLKEIHGIFFLDLQPFLITAGEVDVRFQSGGAMMSKGLFRMSTHEEEQAPGALVRVVCLKGYPYPIQGVSEENRSVSCEVEEDVEFNNRLTHYTIQEIQEDMIAIPPKKPPEGQPNAPAEEQS